MPYNRDDLPIFQEGAMCPCKPTGDGLCDDCGKWIPYYRGQHKLLGGDEEGEQKIKSKGFQSHCPTHLHLANIKDTSMRGFFDAFRKLCMECYLIDWAKRYPDLPPPFTYEKRLI